MEKFTVKRDDARNITFTGELVATAATSANNACSDYSGSVGQWTELELYRTEAGRYICSCVERTQWQGSRDSHDAEVADAEADVIDFFGLSDLAKELYAAAGIDADEEVE